jgi:nitrogen fixation/metabolism regulation signal transduction histidine kinase
LFWSHRFAGPLRVISAGIARMRHGNLAVPVRIRTTDAHQEFAREFQLMQDELRKMIASDRTHVAEAVTLLEAAEKSSPADENISKALDHLRQTCSKYHI